MVTTKPKPIKDIDIPLRPRWHEVINRPESLEDLDQTASTQLTTVQGDIVTLNNTVSTAAAWVTEQLGDLNDELDELETSLEELGTDLETLETNLSTANQELSDLDDELEALDDSLGDLATEDTVSESLLDDNAVTAIKIRDGSVIASKILSGAITTSKLAAGAVTASRITSRTITAIKIASDTITANEIAADTITANEIAADTITTNELNVDELSAISADIGDIDAGTITGVTITGSLFRTATSGERIEMDTTNTNQIRFYDDNTRYGALEVDTEGTDGLIKLESINGGKLEVETGGANAYTAVRLEAYGRTVSVSGTSTNGSVFLGLDSGHYIQMIESSGSIDDDMIIRGFNLIPYGSSQDLGGSGDEWDRAYIDSLYTDYINLDGDIEVDGNVFIDGYFSLYETGSGSNFVQLRAPSSISSNFVLVLPDDDGSSGQYLRTDGNGNLYWG